MRTIKFRGKRIDNGEWIYGDLIHHNSIASKTSIVTESVKDYRDCFVVDYTVGQFTGLHDKYGKEIYEGDIYKNVITGMRYVIEWLNDTSSFISRITGMEYHYWLVRGYFDDMEYVGNIHDNPELLKGGEE